MSISRVIFCILFPPFAVLDKGCGSIVIVSLLTLFGWAPGVIAAIIILNSDGSLKKGYANSFVTAVLMTILLGFIFVSILYVLLRH